MNRQRHDNQRFAGAALFDAAGTLIHLREPVGQTYSRIARHHGVALSPERLDDAFRRTFAAAPPMAFPGAPPADIAELEREWWKKRVRSTFLATDGTARFDDFDEYFGELFDAMGDPSAWRAVEQAHDVLAALRERGWANAVVSNFDYRLRSILAALDLTPLLDEVVLTSDVGAAKPDPAMLGLALERLGVRPARAVVVGDSPDLDGGAAHRAGIRAVDVGSLATLGELLNIIDVH